MGSAEIARRDAGPGARGERRDGARPGDRLRAGVERDGPRHWLHAPARRSARRPSGGDWLDVPGPRLLALAVQHGVELSVSAALIRVARLRSGRAQNVRYNP